MNEPDPITQHQPDGEPQGACPDCQGQKIVRVQIKPDYRREYPCPGCGGTGRFSDNLALRLSGERERVIEQAVKDAVARSTNW